MSFLLSFGSGFRALVAASPPFLLGDARKWHFSHGLPVITTIRVGPWRRAAPKAQDGSTKRITYYWLGSSHMRGMRSFGSVPTCFGWGFSHIERFRPLRMTIRGERMGSYLGDTLRVLELAVLYTIRVGPWRRKSRRGTSEFGLIQRGA